MTATQAASPVTRRWWRDRHRRPWWQVPLYPVVFLDALVLLTWASAGLHLGLLVRPLVVATVVILLLELGCAALLLDRDRAAMVGAVVALLLVTSDDRITVMLGVTGVVIVIEGVVHRGRPAIIAGVATRALSFVAVILLVAIALDLAQRGAWQSAAGDVIPQVLAPAGDAASGTPDIYVLLLDAYPGDRAAALGTSFDADAFPRALETRGFDVVRDAHSNYLLTPLTLTSMLSMRHLADIPALDAPFGPQMADFRRIGEILDAPPAFSAARAAGYRVVDIDGGYAHAKLGGADQTIEQPGPQELEIFLMRNTRIGSLIEAVAPGTAAGLARLRTEGVFRAADHLSTDAAPRLVFVHVPAPHPPWVFNGDGSPRDPRTVAFGGEPELSVQEALDAGFEQATHIADLTVDTIDRILEASATPPVIVVFSDHGPTLASLSSRSTAIDHEIRASSFMAALTPGHGGLFTTVRPTPVNVFGTLYNAYLGTDIPHQDDSIWAWQGESYIDVVKVPPIEGWTR